MTGLILHLALVLAIVLPIPASAVVGIFQRTDCTALSSPVAGQTFCFDSTANQLKAWDGAAWVAVSLPETGIATIAQGGTGAATVAGAQTNLGIPTALPVPAAEGGTGIDSSSPTTGTARVDSGVWSVTDLKVEGSTRAGLGAAGTPGRLKRVTDGGAPDSIVADDGTDWRSIYSRNTAIVVVTDPEFGAVGDGATDDSTAFSDALAATPTGGTLLIPPGLTYRLTSTLTISKQVTVMMHGATLDSTASGALIHVTAQRVKILGGKLQKDGSAGSSIGLDVADATNVGHHITVRELEVTGFDIGVRVQRTFYGGFHDVDSHGNASLNWHITNTAISNDFVNCRGRGEQVTKVGLRIDDTTANSSENRIIGGSFEGSTVQQMDIVGADSSLILGPHVESNAPTSIPGTSVTLTNGSTAISGVGTDFDNDLEVGQYVKLDADGTTAWMRIESITDATNAVLSDQYQGTGGTGDASFASGNIRIVDGSGTAQRNHIVNLRSTIASGSTAGIYIQSGADNRIDSADTSLVTILGASATRPALVVTAMSGGLIDLASDSTVLGDPRNSRHYIKRGGSKIFDLVAGGSQTQINTASQILRVDGISVNSDTGGVAGSTTLTDQENTGTARSSGVGTIKFADATNRDNIGFIKIYIGTTAYHIPVFDAN